MASPTAFTSRLRGKLDAWSDDDEDMIPMRTERSVSKSMTPSEDLHTESREISPAEPSSPKLSPSRKRIARAPCLESDEEDDEQPYRFAKAAKVELSPLSPKGKTLKDAGPIEVFSPRREASFSRAPRSSAPAPPSGPAMQAPVQPGCTQLNDGKSRFLAYSMLGCISRVETEAGFAHVEVILSQLVCGCLIIYDSAC